MKHPQSLSDLRNFLFNRYEIKWTWSLGVSVSAVSLTILGLWSEHPALIAVAGLASSAVPVAVSWLRESATADLLKGDKCRRLVLYADSFGKPVPASQLAEIRSWALGAQLGPAPFEPPYYASPLPPGPPRLADNLTESAFFTKTLAGKCHLALWLIFGLTLIGAAAALLLADVLKIADAGTAAALAKTVGVFIAFLISGDFALVAKKYGDLASEARLVYEACARMRVDASVSVEEVRAVSDDYGVALLQAPPIPLWLYLRYQADLNQMYRDGHS